MLGFESATTDWSKTNGTLGSSTRSADGTHALAISGIGYAELVSAPLASLGDVADTVSLQLLLPAQQPNPWWYGQVSLLVDLPSQGIYSALIGQTNLTGLPLDTFVPISYALPSSVATALRGTYTDLRFKIVLDVPSNTATYLLDALDLGLSASGSQDSGPPRPEQVPVSLSIPEGVELSRAPLVASNVLRVNDGVAITLSDPSRGATLTNTGSYTNIGAGARVPSVRVAGTLVLRDGANVQGYAWAGGTIDKADTANVADGYQAYAPVVPTAIAWDRPFEATAEDIVLEPHTTRAPLVPGRYRTISLKSYAQLELEPGSYEVDRLLLEPDSELAMPGPTRIWVQSELTYRGNVLAHPASFYLAYLGDSSIFIERKLSGTLLAPNAKVDLASLSSGSHRGSVIAEGIEVHQYARFLHVPYTGRGYLAYKAPTQSELSLASSTGFFSLATGWWSGSVVTIDQALQEQACPAEFWEWTLDPEPRPDFSTLADQMLIPDRPLTSAAEGTYADPHITTRDNPEFTGLLELADGQSITECGVDGVCHEFEDKRYDCDTRLDFHYSTHPFCDSAACPYADWNQVDFEVGQAEAQNTAAKRATWELRSGTLAQGQTLFAWGFKDLGTNDSTNNAWHWDADPAAYRDTPNLWTKLDPDVLVVPVVVVGAYLPWRGEDRYDVGMAHFFHGWRLFDYDTKYYSWRERDDTWEADPVNYHDLWDLPRYDVVHPDDAYDMCKIQFRVVAAFEMEADLAEYTRCIDKIDERCQPFGTKERVLDRFRQVYSTAPDIIAMDPTFVLYGNIVPPVGIIVTYHGKGSETLRMASVDPNVSTWPHITAHELTHVLGGNHADANNDPLSLYDDFPSRNATFTQTQCGFPVEQGGVVKPETGLRAAARPFAVRYSQYLQAVGAAVGVVPPAPTREYLNPCCTLSGYEQRNVSPAACLQAGGTSEERVCDNQRYCCYTQGNPPSYAPSCDSSQRLPLSECELDWQCCRLSESEQRWLTSSDCSAQGGSSVDATQCQAFSYCCAEATDDEVAGSFEPCSAMSRPLADCEDVCCADSNAGTAEHDERFNCVYIEGKAALSNAQCDMVCCDWRDVAKGYTDDTLYACLQAGGKKEGDIGREPCIGAM